MPVYADITKPPAPLPAVQFKTFRHGLSLLLPLSRRGQGPGLIVLQNESEDPLAYHQGVPSALIKWAEEGYTVVQINPSALGVNSEQVLSEAVTILNDCEKCEPKTKIGLVGMLPMD